VAARWLGVSVGGRSAPPCVAALRSRWNCSALLRAERQQPAIMFTRWRLSADRRPIEDTCSLRSRADCAAAAVVAGGGRGARTICLGCCCCSSSSISTSCVIASSKVLSAGWQFKREIGQRIIRLLDSCVQLLRPRRTWTLGYAALSYDSLARIACLYTGRCQFC